MSLTIDHYLSSKPGKEATGRVQDKMRVDWTQAHIGGLSAFPGLSELTGNSWRVLDIAPHSVPYIAANAGVTETKDNTSTIAIVATSGKLRFQTQASPSDNDDTAINTTTYTPTLTQGKWYRGYLKLNISSVANYGFTFGLVTSGSTEVFTADPADGLFFVKAKNAATVVGRVRDNSGTAANSGTLATMTDGTDIEFGFAFKVGTSAATTVGYWEVNGVRTAFTSAQCTALYNMYNTTVATLCGHLGFRVNSTTQRNAVVTGARIEVEL